MTLPYREIPELVLPNRAYYTIFPNYNESLAKSKLYVFPKTREN